MRTIIYELSYTFYLKPNIFLKYYFVPLRRIKKIVIFSVSLRVLFIYCSKCLTAKNYRIN